jgi:hypothetical protein
MANFLSGTRRKFVQYGTLVGVGAQTLLHTGSLRAGVADGKEKAGLAAAWP